MSDSNVEKQLLLINAEQKKRIALLEDSVQEKEKTVVALQSSEKRYRRLFESAKDGILILDADTGKVVDVNPFLLQLLGYSYDELCGKYIWEIGVLKDIAASKDAFKVLQDNEYIRYEDLPLETLNGKPISVEFISNVYFVDHAKVIQCNIRDITERKRGELALRESEEFKGAILDSVPSHIAVLDRNGVILAVNKSWVRFAIANGTTDGLPARHVDPGINYLKICRESRGESSEEAMAAHDGILAVLEGILPYFSLEYPCHSPTVQRWFTMTVTPLGMGKSGVVVSHTDITGRKQAEKALRKSEARLKIAMDLAKLVQWEYDVKTGMYSFDDQFYALYGTTSQHEGGALMTAEAYARKFVPPEESHVVAEAIAKTLATTDPNFTRQLEHRIIRADGEERHIIVRWEVIWDPAEGRVVKTRGANQDITERKRAEEKLRESEARLDLAIRSAHMGVWSWNILEDKRYFDHQVCHLLGIDPAAFTGKAEEFFRAVHPDDHEIRFRAALRRVLTEDVLYDTEYRAVWPDGSVHTIIARGRLIRDEAGRPKEINGVIWDVTESKRVEEERERVEAQLRQAQKMESLGTLAGGIAHDFNNILAIIMGYTEMLLLQEDEGSDEHSQLDEVLKAAIRAKELVQQILAFSRRSEEKKQPLQVGLIVKRSFEDAQGHFAVNHQCDSECDFQGGRSGRSRPRFTKS